MCVVGYPGRDPKESMVIFLCEVNYPVGVRLVCFIKRYLFVNLNAPMEVQIGNLALGFERIDLIIHSSKEGGNPEWGFLHVCTST